MGANVAGGQSGHGLSGAQILAKLLALGALGFAIPDNVFNIVGSSDATKIARFEVDGLTTGTTRVYTLPDANIVVSGSASALTSGRVPFVTTGGLLADSAALTWSGTSFATTAAGAASFSTAGGYTSTVATGTAPFTATSTTVCPNLNAALLNGTTWTAPGAIGGGTPSTGAFTTISASGVITSTLATGTAPFTVASTTVVGNLNVSQLLGSTWAAPGTIGSGTPSTGAFTTLTTTGAITASGRYNVSLTDANTSTASTFLLCDHASSGTPAAGFGSQILVRASSDTTATRNQGLFLSEWATATDASRKARLSLWAYDASGPREGIRVEASGSAPMLGFFGTTAVIQPTSTTDLRTALINLGLYASGGATPLNLNAGTLTAGNAVFSLGGSENLVTIGNGTNGFPTVNLRAGSTHYSWFFTAQNAISEAFEIGPSTATGGTTYDKPFFIVYQNGSIVLGSRAALATNATDGFVYMPTCAGTPTGVPTAVTGKVAQVYDTTNNKIYVYNGAWKATAALT